MNRGKEDKRIAEIDAVRGLAALAVVLFHYSWRYAELIPGAQGVPLGLPWGRFGVEIFFGISGFVIFMTLERTKTASGFVSSRFARLFPAFWAAIMITTIAVLFDPTGTLQVPKWAVAANLTMLQGHLGIAAVDTAYWSLSIELSFYACMLAVWRMRLLDRIEWVLIGWLSLKWLWWLIPEMPWRLGYLLIVEYLPFFIIGIASYRVWSGARTWGQQMPLLAFAFATVALIELTSFAVVFLISLSIFAALAEGRLKFLNTGALVWLGGISYALYLVHQNVGYIVMRRLADVGIGPWTAMMTALLIALILAAAVRRWVELPLQPVFRGMWPTTRLDAAGQRVSSRL
jgi:peptidoglycan/LPS O-acetylase OafA/YrhL